MKRTLIALIITFSLASCGGKGKSGKQIAEEVCDCSKKANALPASDPGRSQAQNDCLKKQQEAWNKVKDDEKRADDFNKQLGVCAEEQIKKSFGQ
jgi:hypothetical protein